MNRRSEERTRVCYCVGNMCTGASLALKGYKIIETNEPTQRNKKKRLQDRLACGHEATKVISVPGVKQQRIKHPHRKDWKRKNESTQSKKSGARSTCALA